MVALKPKPRPGARTRNRIREHKDFEPRGEPVKGPAFDPAGGEWQLFRCPDGWVGWLPTDEFEVVL